MAEEYYKEFILHKIAATVGQVQFMEHRQPCFKRRSGPRICVLVNDWNKLPSHIVLPDIESGTT